ncbi:threonylcarbamoyl-AMP synthase [Desulfuribacillus stibiiarsenatis]|uniref:Threonylcarbamoyl-AMP synthase n=1 Tax=Desulfuribacillus stibiiarsenatis TaxID=1390249 RepID=A0A1E5L622_9FIRM|nr:L-threonylcarbamoyladenylate synthase [Desulfuribacillus stibiiarsenatis]OEH85429.1 threonylcarbamoyl-AMP synthase [Desulfuribacillus stibiiarsenatis]
MNIKTQLVYIDSDSLDSNQNQVKVQQAAELLCLGQVVAFPTETVYGLGANAFDYTAVQRIFEAKGRPSDNPLIVHVKDIQDIDAFVNHSRMDTNMWDKLMKLAKAFWPGPLTCILPANDALALNVTAGLDTVGIRVPNHPVALALLEQCNLPIAAPSANVSGKPSPTKAEHVYHDLQGRIPVILDGGETGVGVESTVLDLTTDIPMVLRPGGASLESLRECIGQVEVDIAIESMHHAPKSPGMKYTHYSPDGDVAVFLTDSAHIVVQTIRTLPQDATVGLICSKATYQEYFDGLFNPHDGSHSITFLRVHENDSVQIASSLYHWLRELDQLQVEHIFIEEVCGSGLGYAIMNRIVKASGGNVL